MRARVCVYERLNWVFFKRFIDSCNLLSPPLSTFHKRSIAFRCLLCTGIDANRDPPHLSSDRTRHRPAHQPHGFGAWALGLLPQCKHPLFSQHTTCSTWIQQSSTCRSPLPSTCSHSLFPGMIHRHPAKPPLFSCVLCPANNAGSYSIVSLPNPLDTGNMHVCMCMYAFCVAVIPVAPLCFVLSFTFGGLRRRMADGCLPFQHHTYLHGLCVLSAFAAASRESCPATLPCDYAPTATAASAAPLSSTPRLCVVTASNHVRELPPFPSNAFQSYAL